MGRGYEREMYPNTTLSGQCLGMGLKKYVYKTWSKEINENCYQKSKPH